MHVWLEWGGTGEGIKFVELEKLKENASFMRGVMLGAGRKRVERVPGRSTYYFPVVVN